MSEINGETIIKLQCGEKISIFSLARWLCLIEAFEHIKEFAEDNNIDLKKCEFIKKPASLYDYINAKQPKMEEAIIDCIKKYGTCMNHILEIL